MSLDKVFDFIREFWGKLIFWVVVPQYEGGILLRLGKFERLLKVGFNFKRPIIDEADTTSIVIQTMELPTQTINDRIVASILRYQVDDVKAFLLEVDDADDVIRDVSLVSVRRAMETYNEPDKIEKSARTRIRRGISKYGVKVLEIGITDYGKVKSLRIIMDEAE